MSFTPLRLHVRESELILIPVVCCRGNEARKEELKAEAKMAEAESK